MRLNDIAQEMRNRILKLAYMGRSGHIATSLSAADLLTELYFDNLLRYDAEKPDWEERDRFVLSKGHASLLLYNILAKAGYFSFEELNSYCQPGTRFGSHPTIAVPGVEASTGALGHGYSYAAGVALAAKMDDKDYLVYALLGDGECQEGSVWEGALSAPSLNLDNLTVIIDHNKLQAMDCLENIVQMRPFADKWKAFGWNVLEIDGHNFTEIREALISRQTGKPTLIIANTIKGKGVSFMESVPIWHYRMPNEQELPVLMKELGLTEKDLDSK